MTAPDLIDESFMPKCHTCEKRFHPLGIARHRAMHRDKKEDCLISLSDGTFCYEYSARKKRPWKCSDEEMFKEEAQ